MIKIFPGLLLLVASTAVSAQNIVRDAHAEVRRVSSFNKVKVSGSIALYLSQGNQQGVAISSDEGKYNDRILTKVSNGVLDIYVESGRWNKWNWGNNELKAYVTVTDLEMLEASGATTVRVTDPLSFDNLKMEVSGASTLKGPFRGKSLSLNINGASSVDIDGVVSMLSVEASGASSFKGFDLKSTSCRARASGASSVNIMVDKELDAEASGASSVRYSGNATITKVDVSGASTIKKKNG